MNGFGTSMYYMQYNNNNKVPSYEEIKVFLHCMYLNNVHEMYMQLLKFYKLHAEQILELDS